MKPEYEADYREFVAVHLHKLGRFAYLLCHDWHRAEDAVQQALLKAYLRWHKTDIQSPEAYVRRIIAHVLIDEGKRQWFKRERSSDTVPDIVVPDPTSGKAERLTILDALTRLPKRQRLAVVLRHWEDLSVEQTAEIMNCSPGNVKSQTAHGLKSLRALLQNQPQAQTTGASR